MRAMSAFSLISTAPMASASTVRLSGSVLLHFRKSLEPPVQAADFVQYPAQRSNLPQYALLAAQGTSHSRTALYRSVLVRTAAKSGNGDRAVTALKRSGLI